MDNTESFSCFTELSENSFSELIGSCNAIMTDAKKTNTKKNIVYDTEKKLRSMKKIEETEVCTDNLLNLNYDNVENLQIMLSKTLEHLKNVEDENIQLKKEKQAMNKIIMEQNNEIKKYRETIKNDILKSYK